MPDNLEVNTAEKVEVEAAAPEVNDAAATEEPEAEKAENAEEEAAALEVNDADIPENLEVNEAEKVEVEAIAPEVDLNAQIDSLQAKVESLKADRDAKRKEIRDLWQTTSSKFKGSSRERKALRKTVRKQVRSLRDEVKEIQS